MIADEVICGFGRLGQMFGSLVYGIDPDLMTVAKQLTSGYFPLSACLVSEGSEGCSAMAPPRSAPSPTGSPTAATRWARLRPWPISTSCSARIWSATRRAWAYLQERLCAALGQHPLVGDVRGVGLIAGVELVADRASRQLFAPALKVAPRSWPSAWKTG